ncbi:hypothetical protein N7499_010244 [Penicillium canescens]|nr:hypothetical protein N7499_010244 [Penicillium canescens]
MVSMSEPAEPTIADRYFICNKQWGVAICRQCEHGVKPKEIVRHLTNPKGKHRVRKGVAEQVVDIIRHADEWDSVKEETSWFPTSVNRPVPVLPIYQDGLQCQFCQQIYRSRDSLRVHWSRSIGFPRTAMGASHDHPRSPQASRTKRSEPSESCASGFFPVG